MPRLSSAAAPRSSRESKTQSFSRTRAGNPSLNGAGTVSRPQSAAQAQSISSRNAEGLTWSYLQDMRSAPLSSPVRDDIGSDIENDDGSDGFRNHIVDAYNEDELADDYLRNMQQGKDGTSRAAEPLAFGSSSPTKRLASPAPPTDNPWVPSSSFRRQSSQSRMTGVSIDRSQSASVAANLMHMGSSRINPVADLEAQIKDLRVQINRMTKTSPRAAARAQAQFEAGFATAATDNDDDDEKEFNGSGLRWEPGASVPLNDPSHPDFFASVRRDYGSPAAGETTWAERVRRQFEDEGLLDGEEDERAAAAEAKDGGASSGVGRLHAFGNKKVTVPQPFTRMERHAIYLAEKKKMHETDQALKETDAAHGRPRDYETDPVPEQAGSSHRFDDQEADLINRIQGRAAYAVKPKKIAEAAYLNLCHKGNTTRSEKLRRKGMTVAPQGLRKKKSFRANYPAPDAGPTLRDKTEQEQREREERIRERSRALAADAKLPSRMDNQLRKTGRFFTTARPREEKTGKPTIKQMPNFAKLHSKWDNFKRATLKTKSPTRPADFSFNRRNSAAYKTREDIMRSKAARKHRMEEKEEIAEKRRKDAVSAAAAAALYQEPALRAKTTKAHEYRVLKTQRLLDERRQEEVVAEERAVQRQVRDRQASQQVTRHYREKEKQRRRKYEDEGRLQIYEQASPSYVSDERARERADAARREYRDRLRELKDQIQEAVANGPHIVDRLEIEEKRQENKKRIMERYPGTGSGAAAGGGNDSD